MTSQAEHAENLDSIPEKIVQALFEALGKPPFALHAPTFSGNEWAYTKECLDSTYVSSVGAFVDRFESDLALYTGAKHAIAVVNGTAALHVALLLAGVAANDEVLVPALTFIATANAIKYCGAIPHFIDSNEATLGADPKALDEWLSHTAHMSNGVCVNKKTGRRISAMVLMHTFGHPNEIESLQKIAGEYGFTIVEDAAEGLGSFYHDQHVGTFGQVGTLSFNGNKTITTGGGGAILTNNSKLAQRAKFITTTAKRPHKWDYVHDEVGFNYRMPNINAALGCAQLEKLPEFLSSKRALFHRYSEIFSSIDDVEIVAEPSDCNSNYWLQTLKLSDAAKACRDEVLEATNNAGFMTRPIWKLMHKLKPYETCPRAPLSVAEGLEQRLINLPSSAGLV